MREPINNIDYADVIEFRAYGMMDHYARIATGNATYPGKGTALGLVYLGLKLNGEAGELAEHIGKAMRDEGLFNILELPGDGEAYENAYAADLIPGVALEDDRRDKIIKEVGDCLWYIAALCEELGITFKDVASANLEKLYARDVAGTQRGEGDDR